MSSPSNYREWLQKEYELYLPPWYQSLRNSFQACWDEAERKGATAATAAERVRMRPTIEDALDVLGIMRDVATRDFQVAAQMKAEMAIAGLETAIREEAEDE